MTTEFLNLVAQMYPKPPKARVQPFRLKLDKRSTANRLAMNRKRAEWHAQGLNSHGKPINGNAKFRNQKYFKLNEII